LDKRPGGVVGEALEHGVHPLRLFGGKFVWFAVYFDILIIILTSVSAQLQCMAANVQVPAGSLPHAMLRHRCFVCVSPLFCLFSR
jgi:hypothetical protein